MRAARYKQVTGEVGTTRVIRFIVQIKSQNAVFFSQLSFLSFQAATFAYNIKYEINFAILMKERQKLYFREISTGKILVSSIIYFMYDIA